MKKKTFSVLFIFILCTILAGCTDSVQEQSFEEFMKEVNDRHEAVVKFDGDYKQYITNNKEDDFYFSTYAYNTEYKYDEKAVLSLEQAEEDVDVLFKSFRTKYGLYNYFDGDETFNAAKDLIMQDIAKTEALTGGMFNDILRENLSFIQDGHFYIETMFNEIAVPFFFREVSFIKTAEGYRTDDGKTVKSVEGYDDLNELFKPSISDEGMIVYYPVVLEKRIAEKFIEEPQECTVRLTINYTDKSTQLLTAEPYKLSARENGVNITFHETDGIPVVVTEGFDFNKGGNKFLNSALEFKNEPVSIVDLRLNNGGTSMANVWLKAYAGEVVASNSSYINSAGILIDDYPDKFVDNENLLIILTSKYTASAAEEFVDTAHNLKNTLFIGENTGGMYRGVERMAIQLPNSHIGVTMQLGMALLPEDENYFQETRGFCPDLWVPADEAESAAVKFVSRIMR